MIVLDNSSSAINGDYEPTRWLAQIEAAGLLIQTKLEQSHENVVGVTLSAGTQVEVVCAPTNDSGKVNSNLYGLKVHGQQKLAIVTMTLFRPSRPRPSLSSTAPTRSCSSG